ncbi:LLM class flavin-dependent oxidoreductase [Rathayibacter sp. AY1B7]|uniref:LLM class flavin-dependent oxidoreductase n=1 Tax=unclassified Rathayibacter TaxID=2609250 RepID=UPI000CE85EC0|nr:MULTISPECIES: LLM class flavin-dependent oxidoreductase [unclassified Rathayibacter]PPH98073.1 LLM class flavin-dependent oxidoreductase [Rathayibacter sp. AY1B7]PPI41770.1 LLM class flavin-dependent oxidoreductase [Rathayibacter sp. RFBD1]PPI51527.1 LLM class flavin-dependent oxidoreductase [Rathayibacter sp. TRS19]
MARRQHFGWFFSRGFGPQGWGHPYREWNHDWTKPGLYQQSARELEQAGFELIVMEDAVSLGSPETLDLRVRGAYGGPKHDPLLLAPYLFAATERIGLAPTINAGITPPYLAARQAATLQHLSSDRFGINLVTDVGSARHVGLEPLSHDAAYDRADEWMAVVRRLWHSWGEGALVADPESGRYADGTRIDAFRHRGEHFRVDGPLNAVPFANGDPIVVSPGGSPRGLAFAGTQSDVQLALAPLEARAVRDYRARVLAAAEQHGRTADDLRVLFVVKPEIVSSPEEAARVVEASRHPDEDALRRIALGWSSDLETDLTGLDLDLPVPRSVFGEHVSHGTIAGLYGGTEDAPLRELLIRKARKGRVAERAGFVGTAEEFADFVEELGDDGGSDGLLLSGDLHPVTLHRMLDDLVPVLRRRGILRDELAPGGTRANLFGT